MDIIILKGNLVTSNKITGFPGSSDNKASVCKAGDAGSIPGSGRSPGEGNGNPLWYSCLGNLMERGAWQGGYSPWGCKESDFVTEHIHKTILIIGKKKKKRTKMVLLVFHILILAIL